MHWLITHFRDQPLRNKLRAVVFGTSLVTMLFVMGVYITYECVAVSIQMREDLTARAQIIAANSTAALVFRDAAAATETLDALSRTPDVITACVYRQDMDNSAASYFAGYARNKASSCLPSWPAPPVQNRLNTMQVSFPVWLDSKPIGFIVIVSDRSKLWHRIRTVAWGSAVVTLIITLLALVFSRIVELAIARPIVALRDLMQQVAATDDYALRAARAGKDELDALARGFNDMLARVQTRDGELREAHEALRVQIRKRDEVNADLKQALERLRTTQDQLVQSEKMASLGGLVAGIAHEINTPIGVAFTAASTLQSRSHDLRDAYAEGALRRSTLDRYVQQASEIGDMIVKNLGRAAELIQSFKQVAVDQTSGERRRFALRSYIEETLLSLRPRLKKLPYDFDVACDPDLMVNGYPGAVSQILTNLIMNSVIHGFDGRDTGRITIDARVEGTDVVLRYSDNGAGLSRDARARIFDPFFTTRRGQGGSGLGMHIVYNLVTRTLGGTITIPEVAEGAAFHIRFPCEAPA